MGAMILNQMLDRVISTRDSVDKRNKMFQYSPEIIEILASIHLSALVGSVPSVSKLGHLSFGNISVELVARTGREGGLSYEDINVSFDARGIAIDGNEGPSKIWDLLELLHFAREGSDALLYSPAEKRAGRIKAISAARGTSEKFAKFIFANWPAIEREFDR